MARSGASARSAPHSGDGVRFVLDGEIVSPPGNVSPQTTVLEFLREHLGRTGTKEGCAEGDCGACTVVLVERSGDEALRWRPVNACIRLLPTIDGKALVTVESLRSPNGALHPVQQAMVDCHASQCGFCTPGFAMSLFGMYKNATHFDRAACDEALSGNLCRCTGYRPLIAAAQRMRELPAAEGWRGPGRDAQGRRLVSSEERALGEQLARLGRDQGLVYEPGGQRYAAPVTADELALLCTAHPEAQLVAGTTDVGLWVTKQQRDLGTIIYTGNVRELLALRTTPAHFEIGAAVALTDAFALLRRHYPALGEVWSRFGSVPIRNAATLGGNIANGSPVGDTMPVLLALGATLILRQGDARRELPLEAFYLGYQSTARRPGEFLETIRVPRPEPEQELCAYKVSKRFDQDISAVFACFNLRREARAPGARVAAIRIGCGGVAAIPKRAAQCEQALTGVRWDEAAVAAGQAALDRDFEPISDLRAGAAYRRAALKNLLRRFHIETAGSGLKTRAVEYVAP
jgi:xanthine dehydrogenase small subunit